MIQFLVNRELRSEHALDPNMTVLQYLREHLGKPGTKEGCASGDCGACTVVVGELTQDDQGRDTLRYRSLNSCLTFVSSLHGKQLISVEGLKHQGELHSVQRAMADCHGSQCGFCTPGFVMSLFALQKNSDGHDLHQAQEALARQPVPLHRLPPDPCRGRAELRPALPRPVRRATSPDHRPPQGDRPDRNR